MSTIGEGLSPNPEKKKDKNNKKCKVALQAIVYMIKCTRCVFSKLASCRITGIVGKRYVLTKSHWKGGTTVTGSLRI